MDCHDALESTNFTKGGGEMGALIRAFDWSATSIGPISTWPQSLKSVTSLLLLSPVPIVLLWGEDGIMIYNDGYSAFAGQRHPELLGSKVREGWPEVAEFNDNIMKVGLAGGTLQYREHELRLRRRDAFESVWLDLDYSPVLDESGNPAGVIAIVVEITEKVEAERKLRESEERLHALVDASSDVIYRMSPDWKIMHPLEGRGLIADNHQDNSRWLEENLPAEEHSRVLAAIQNAVESKKPFQLEHRVLKPDGSIGWTLSRAIPVLDAQGEIAEWFGAASDISDRRKAEEHLRLIINELNHRVKNNLAMTQAIAIQTFRGRDNVKDEQDRFSARMVALAQANDLLTGERWAGASLRGAVEQALGPLIDDAGKVHIDGPDLQITPKSALALSLAIHELVTNAVKYGAWSVRGGQVSLTWALHEGRRLHIEWRESGGPAVSAPTSRGFGSRLIERGLAGELGGTAKMHFERDGLVCIVDAPLSLYDDQ